MLAAMLALALVPTPAAASPTRTEAILAMNDGVALAREGHLAKAETELRAAVRVDPSYPLSHYNLGIVQRRQGKLVEAKASFQSALETSEGETAVEMRDRLGEVVFEIASAERLSHRDRASALDEALELSRAVVAAEPHRARAHLRIAWCLERLDRPIEADAAYRRAIERSPDLGLAYVSLGNMYLDYGHKHAGLAVLQAGTQAAGTDVATWLALGNGLVMAKEPREAVRAYKKARAVDPDRIEVLLRLGLALAELQEREEALEVLTEFSSRAGDDTPRSWKQAADSTAMRLRDVGR